MGDKEKKYIMKSYENHVACFFLFFFCSPHLSWQLWHARDALKSYSLKPDDAAP